MMLEKLGIRSLLNKLRRIHPSHHQRRSIIIRQMVTILDNWIARNDITNQENLMALASVLELISREDYYVYTELIKITRYPQVYRRAVNFMKWARLHKRLGGVLPAKL